MCRSIYKPWKCYHTVKLLPHIVLLTTENCSALIVTILSIISTCRTIFLATTTMTECFRFHIFCRHSREIRILSVPFLWLVICIKYILTPPMLNYELVFNLNFLTDIFLSLFFVVCVYFCTADFSMLNYTVLLCA